MNKEIPRLTERPEWQALVKHQQAIAHRRMRDCFLTDEHRFSSYMIHLDELMLDYSRNQIDQKTLSLLFDLADSSQLRTKIHQLFNGSPLNVTEQRAALHTALRDKHQPPLHLDGENIAEQISHVKEKMSQFVQQIHAGEWKGITGKPIQQVVTIGMGGSYLGPMMCVNALKDHAISSLQFHFVANIDPTLIQDITDAINPETTLFIISSKTFTTLETIANATTLLNWMQAKLGKEVANRHFIAVTADMKKAISFGLPAENIFTIWDWVGGRYSIWSAIGLPLMLMIGAKQFDEFLEGAHAMDRHFYHAEFASNMPIILGLLGIWYVNFFGAKVQAIIPYSHRLRYLISYLQQADMESNGKQTDIHGNAILYTTGPVIFGGDGCNGQHAYHQLLHQGQHLIPADFILLGKSHPSENNELQNMLFASGLSQAQALMLGKSREEALNEHYYVPGNRPSNILILKQLNPKNLGMLLALYEHKVFVQSVIWNINPFDQCGVELGKQLLPDILNKLTNPTTDITDNNLSEFITYLKQFQGSL